MALRFMDEIKNDEYYLKKIKDDLEFMIKHMQGVSQQAFEVDELLIDSMLFRIIQIAENNEHLTKEFKEVHKDIPWTAIKGMRNRIVHDYGFIDLTKVYQTLNKSVPELLEFIKEYV